MRKAVCIKSFAVEMCDDNGFFLEDYMYVDEGKVFQIDDTSFRVVGGSDTARLVSDDGTWLEITPEDFSEYFKEVDT